MIIRTGVAKNSQNPQNSLYLPLPSLSPSLRSLNSASTSYVVIKLGPPRLSRILSFIYSQLIWDFNYIYKIPSQQQLDWCLIEYKS